MKILYKTGYIFFKYQISLNFEIYSMNINC